MSGGKRVLVTGAAGYLGTRVVPALAADRAVAAVVATDVRLPFEPAGEEPVASAEQDDRPGEDGRGRRRTRGGNTGGEPEEGAAVVWEECDVRDGPRIRHLLARHGVDTVVHLASIVTPPPGSTPELAYQVDVVGTRNVLDACLAHGVDKLIVTSSGAAYGYHPDNPAWLDEGDPVRGHESFAYARHKRLVEEMLAEARREHPELVQVIFRPGTILGKGVHNQITALFEKPVLLGVAGAASPFVFIWDEDVAACVVRAVHRPGGGIYNLAGDGALATRELARRMGKPYLPLPVWLLVGALAVLGRLGLTRYGPEQVDFLRYRPVLANRRLKEEFGYTPRKTSAQVFDLYWTSR